MRKIFLFVAALCSSASLLATEQLINGINYDLDEGELKAKVVAKDPLYTGDIVIPATVVYDAKTYNVVRIDNEAFHNCVGVTSVSLPEGLVEIGSDAFWACEKLTSITIPSTVTTIEDYAFELTGLTSFTLPNTVTNCGNYVFTGCNDLATPVYNNKFFVFMPQSYSGTFVIPEGITIINDQAFWDCTGLTGITLPSTLETIGSSAFEYAGITSLVIPNSVTAIESYAFSATNLATVTFGTGLTQINGSVFQSTKLTSVSVPEGVQYVSSEAFSNCDYLTTVSLPATLETIDSDVFKNCPNIENFSVAAGNPNYDSRDGCNALIQKDEDRLVLGFKTSTIPDGIKIIGSGAFATSKIASITIPSSVKVIESYAFHECEDLTSCNLPNSVEKIGDYAFKGCSLPAPLHNDKIFAFLPTTTKGEVTIPDGIVTIAGQSMAYCREVAKINFPTSLKTVGSDVFWYIDSIRSITLPEGVDSIGAYAFDYCEKLETITLPSTLHAIYESSCYAFWHCENLKTIICNVETPIVVSDLFESDVVAQSSIKLYVPDASVGAYTAAAGWNGFDVQPISNVPTGIEDIVNGQSSNRKFIKGGQLFIERDGKTFNAQGIEVR